MSGASPSLATSVMVSSAPTCRLKTAATNPKVNSDRSFATGAISPSSWRCASFTSASEGIGQPVDQDEIRHEKERVQQGGVEINRPVRFFASFRDRSLFECCIDL